MKRIGLLMLVVFPFTAFTQGKIFTKAGVISFNAGTAVEDIDATCRSATSVIDTQSGQMEFAVLIKGFEFKRALMQEHFNENYMESERFPKAMFRGKIKDVSAVSFAKDGVYPVVAAGILEIHGVKKDVEIPATITIAKGSTTGVAEFVVALADYDIEIPKAVADKISPTVQVRTQFNYKPL